jgi:LDH2 family malate/lactate/ureidoglycolate dehydrogenase
MTEAIQYFSAEQLREFSQRTFEYFGVPTLDVAQAADVLALSDLRGVDSHGVARLHTYFDMLALGRVNPRPNIRIVRELPATVDGNHGLGLVAGPLLPAVVADLLDISERTGPPFP